MAHIYDYAIIGSGLTGLSIAAALSRETQNIALIESSETFAGFNKSAKMPTGLVNNGIRFVPDTELARQSIHFLENLLGLKINKGSQEAAPLTYEGGQLKTFLGFGDNPPPFYEDLNYFTHDKHMVLSLEPHMWAQLLFEKFKGEFFPRSYVTKFNYQDGKATQVTINGAKVIQANNFIFCGSVKDLALLLPEEALSIRARTKLSKNVYWTGLCLDLCHSHQVTEANNVHVLNGTTQDEIGPCAGRFLPAVEVEGQKLQVSQWISFVADEETEDSEIVGTALKKMKRQIKRAYPDALENIKLERIIVVPQMSGNGDIKLNANLSLPELENVWVASAATHAQKNLVGSLLQAEMVVAAMGFKVEAASNLADFSAEQSTATEAAAEL